MEDSLFTMEVCFICSENTLDPTEPTCVECVECSKRVCLSCVLRLKELKCPFCRMEPFCPELVEYHVRMLSYSEFLDVYAGRFGELYRYRTKEKKNILMLLCEYNRPDLFYVYSSIFLLNDDYADIFYETTNDTYLMDYILQYTPDMFYLVLNYFDYEEPIKDEWRTRIFFSCLQYHRMDYALFICNIFLNSIDFMSLSRDELIQFIQFLEKFPQNHYRYKSLPILLHEYRIKMNTTSR